MQLMIKTFLRATWTQARRAFHFLGFEVSLRHDERSQENRIIHQISRFQIKTVLDVGANIGQFSETLIRAGYDGQIVSFEPLEREHQVLSKIAARYNCWKVAERCALGAESGVVEMHRSEASPSSSILRVLPVHTSAAQEARVVAKECVTVQRLDDLSAKFNIAGKPILLKIDVQGFELEVMRGATGVMPDVRVIMVEASLVQLYDRAPVFAEVVNHLHALGFSVVDLLPGLHSKTGELLQVDLIAART